MSFSKIQLSKSIELPSDSQGFPSESSPLLKEIYHHIFRMYINMNENSRLISLGKLTLITKHKVLPLESIIREFITRTGREPLSFGICDKMVDEKQLWQWMLSERIFRLIRYFFARLNPIGDVGIWHYPITYYVENQILMTDENEVKESVKRDCDVLSKKFPKLINIFKLIYDHPNITKYKHNGQHPLLKSKLNPLIRENEDNIGEQILKLFAHFQHNKTLNFYDSLYEIIKDDADAILYVGELFANFNPTYKKKVMCKDEILFLTKLIEKAIEFWNSGRHFYLETMLDVLWHTSHILITHCLIELYKKTENRVAPVRLCLVKMGLYFECLSGKNFRDIGYPDFPDYNIELENLHLFPLSEKSLTPMQLQNSPIFYSYKFEALALLNLKLKFYERAHEYYQNLIKMLVDSARSGKVEDDRYVRYIFGVIEAAFALGKFSEVKSLCDSLAQQKMTNEKRHFYNKYLLLIEDNT